jgi:hypothetical protein
VQQQRRLGATGAQVGGEQGANARTQLVRARRGPPMPTRPGPLPFSDASLRIAAAEQTSMQAVQPIWPLRLWAQIDAL